MVNNEWDVQKLDMVAVNRFNPIGSKQVIFRFYNYLRRTYQRKGILWPQENV